MFVTVLDMDINKKKEENISDSKTYALYFFLVSLTLRLVSVGGIYTVIRSKAYVSTEEMGENYCLLGSYF